MNDLLRGFADAMGYVDRMSFNSFFYDVGFGFGTTVVMAALAVFFLCFIFIVFGRR